MQLPRLLSRCQQWHHLREPILLGTRERSQQSFTLIEFTDDAIRIAAYAAPDFEEEIDWSTLPTHIRSSAAELMRADLADVAIKPLEASRQP